MTKSQPIVTMLTLTVAMLVLYAIFNKNWMMFAALTIGVIGLFSTTLSYWVDFIWMQFSGLLSSIFPKIVLSLFYFMVLFPIAMASRLFVKNDVLRLKNKQNSMFVETKKDYTKSFFEKTW